MSFYGLMQEELAGSFRPLAGISCVVPKLLIDIKSLRFRPLAGISCVGFFLAID